MSTLETLPYFRLASWPSCHSREVPSSSAEGVRPLDQQSWSHDASLFFSKLVLDKEVTVTVQVTTALLGG